MGSARAINYASTACALIALATAIIMSNIFPSRVELPKGFNTPIIAFEFAKTEADIPYLIGSSEFSSSNRQTMRDGHRWEMVFPFAYAGFIFYYFDQCPYSTLI